jgi:hypothetical protein
MTTNKQLGRLLFTQGGRCFFCDGDLSTGEASVEHLLASANGGRNSDDNCVVCCKALNAVLGSMSLKEKIRVFLNQQGNFKCPSAGSGKREVEVREESASKAEATDRTTMVIADLRKRGKARPRTVKTLTNTVSALFKKTLTDEALAALLAELQASGVITIDTKKVTYKLPDEVE